MGFRGTVTFVSVLLLAYVFDPVAVAGARVALDPQGIERLAVWSGGEARVHLHPGTGAVRFVSLGPLAPRLSGSGPAERASDFLARHGRVFGVTRPEQELTAPEVRVDRHGFHHVTYRQVYLGLPVFAGVLRAHFDPGESLVAVNGTFLPGIEVDPLPTREPAEIEAAAIEHVRREVAGAPTATLEVRASRLLVFRSGLVRRVSGADHLAYEVEVTSVGVRELVYVDAHTAIVVERITGMQEILGRTVHEGAFNDVIIWDEGDSLPYSTGDPVNDDQVNTLISASAEVYDLYSNLSGGSYLSWDGASGTMHSVWKPVHATCPNATWDGNSTNYCDGVASDDVVGHEWTHGYTQSSGGLIYAWQPGALNEAYSDIFGEVVDLLDGSGTDSPSTARAVGDCTTFGPEQPPLFEVHAPASIAGSYAVSGATFNPAPPKTATGSVVLVNDGAGIPTDGCQAYLGFPAGSIALVDAGGGCAVTAKAFRAQNAGAIGMIVHSGTPGNGTTTMGGTLTSNTIPCISLGNTDGNTLKAQLGVGVNATITLHLPSPSVRWLVGEDAQGLNGSFRDLWNPNCFDTPAAVSDALYYCEIGDNGGVHTNSGVPAHAFSLLVDGGTFNGHTVAAIGLTKATHLYWRAMEAYHVPDTDFADHADALTQSCADLLGVDLTDLDSGASAGASISAADCAQVAEALLSVGMSDEPPCTFAPLLDPDPPPFPCESEVFSDDFEADPTATWIRSNSGVHPEYTPRDWEWTAALPPGGSGSAWFAPNAPNLGVCIEGSSQSGRMSLDSPEIVLGAGLAVLRFDHYVATEPGFDGGNVEISVNAGSFVPVEAGDFLFNAYNAVLFPGPDSSNPKAGEPAFTGSDGGSVHGTWAQSHVRLFPYAGAGDSVRLRFDFGVNGCHGREGWYVDDVVVCSASPAAGRVPDGSSAPGTQLRAARAPLDEITLSWGASCLALDEDYEVYEGVLSNFASHAVKTCSTAGATSYTFPPAAGNHYYLVVPRNTLREGSYGVNGAGVERPAAAAACLPQSIAPGCF